ncbi:hypothetical protein Scep_027037 [Stephania cephalantha]|uniref:C2H2-type domain-containing protein n=1 Tax=Stephania cephalantha TaxID=152367 RepID=A0AAP0ERW4_9MAGN
MYGHMRCHPERDWRGILPPHPTPITSSSTSFNWSVTAKRGRKSIGSVHPGKPLSEAALSGPLMMMVSNDYCKTPTTTTTTTTTTLTHHHHHDHDHHEEEHNMEQDQDSFSLDYFCQGVVDIAQTNLELEERRTEQDQDSKSIRKKKKLQHVKDYLDEEMVELESAYKCSICNKSFPTHQALGGHKSSHYNKLIKTTTTTTTTTNTIAAAGIMGDDHGKELALLADHDIKAAKSTGELSLHQCEICQKTFPTGQALGGHKRRHWTGPADHEPPPPPPPLAIEFDLNELPPMDQEETEEVVVFPSVCCQGNHQTLEDCPV